MKTSKVLEKALKLLTEKGWCQGEHARNKYSHQISPTHQNAVRYCSYGAIYSVLNINPKANGPYQQEPEEVIKVADYLKQAIPVDKYQWGFSPALVNFNDANGTKIEDIQALFTRAIQLAKKDEKV